ncbi:MAG TPA: hypothetical protein PLB81_12285, partial [Deltaproteobacteria bacterium]|nr:hypothetical protein [Deltaproteobacteria bacterium]
LTPEKQSHLAECPVCRAQSARLAGDLSGLGDMAKAMVPPMQTTIMLPEAKALKPARPWGLRLAYGSALAAALVVLVLAVPVLNITPGNKLEVVYRNMLSDAKLMIEIDRMVENPMPDTWAAFDDDFEAEGSDDFMEDIAPGGEDFS